jgi:hypothetical protein
MSDHQASQSHRLGHDGSRPIDAAPIRSARHDLWDQSRLLVQLAPDRLARRDVGLDLDDDYRPGRWFEAEDVNRATLAELR